MAIRTPQSTDYNNTLSHWYKTELGTHLVNAERKILDEFLPTLFGDYLIQLGGANQHLLKNSRIIHRTTLFPNIEDNAMPNMSVVCNLRSGLPLKSDIADVVILLHLLECIPHRHILLREVQRILVGGGHVLIIGFHPWSLWGLAKLVPYRRKRVPWGGKFISPAQLRDWLSLLDFEIIAFRRFFFIVPWAIHESNYMNCLNPLLGGVYMFLAKKRVVPVTPIKWQRATRQSVLVSGRAAETSYLSFQKC